MTRIIDPAETSAAERRPFNKRQMWWYEGGFPFGDKDSIYKPRTAGNLLELMELSFLCFWVFEFFIYGILYHFLPAAAAVVLHGFNWTTFLFSYLQHLFRTTCIVCWLPSALHTELCWEQCVAVCKAKLYWCTGMALRATLYSNEISFHHNTLRS